MNGTGTNLGLRPFFERMIKNDIQLNEEKLKLFTAEGKHNKHKKYYQAVQQHDHNPLAFFIALQEREEANFKEIKTKSEKHQALITELLVILKDRIKLLQSVVCQFTNYQRLETDCCLCRCMPQ